MRCAMQAVGGRGRWATAPLVPHEVDVPVIDIEIVFAHARWKYTQHQCSLLHRAPLDSMNVERKHFQTKNDCGQPHLDKTELGGCQSTTRSVSAPMDGEWSHMKGE